MKTAFKKKNPGGLVTAAAVVVAGSRDSAVSKFTRSALKKFLAITKALFFFFLPFFKSENNSLMFNLFRNK